MAWLQRAGGATPSALRTGTHTPGRRNAASGRSTAGSGGSTGGSTAGDVATTALTIGPAGRSTAAGSLPDLARKATSPALTANSATSAATARPERRDDVGGGSSPRRKPS